MRIRFLMPRKFSIKRLSGKILANPSMTYWEMAHGSGSGCESVENWVHDNIDLL